MIEKVEGRILFILRITYMTSFQITNSPRPVTTMIFGAPNPNPSPTPYNQLSEPTQTYLQFNICGTSTNLIHDSYLKNPTSTTENRELNKNPSQFILYMQPWKIIKKHVRKNGSETVKADKTLCHSENHFLVGCVPYSMLGRSTGESLNKPPSFAIYALAIKVSLYDLRDS